MAKKITEESLRLNIIVNGDKARQQILATEKQLDALQTSQQKLLDKKRDLEAAGKTETKQYRDTETALRSLGKSIEESKTKLDQMRKGMPLTSMTMAELRKHINQTRTALAHAVPGTDNWKRLNREVQEAKTRLKQLEVQSLATDKTLCGIAGNFRDYYISLRGGFDIARQVGRYVTQATDAYMAYDEAMTDTMKTTNLTKDEVAALGEEFKKIDTRTAQNELMNLARVGGKLGISGQEDLLGFVRAADKINVALSEDLGGDAEAAIAAIGKMVDIFQLEDKFGLEESLLKVGSAVNSLGMASTANEGYIVDFTKRLAGIAPNADISIDKILGLAATLDKYGQTSEMSATAIGQTIMAMFKRTETFAGIAKMGVEEFTQLLNKDVNEAFIRVLEGMKGTDGSLHSVVAAMDEMHLNGQRAAQVLGTLSKNTDELRAQQGLANQSFMEGTSILDEFATKNDSATARMEKSKNAIHNQVVVIGQQLMPVVQGVMDVAEVGAGLLSKLVRLFAEQKAIIIALTVAYAAHKTITTGIVAIKKLLVFWSKENRKALAAELATMRHANAGTLALAAVQNLLAGSFKGAAVAAKMFGKALMSNPIGLVVGIVSALVGGLVALSHRSNETTKALRELSSQTKETSAGYVEAATKIDDEREALDKLKTAALNAAIGSDERARAIKAINDKYAEYLPNLLTEKFSNEEVETALKGVNDEMERRILLQAKEAELVKVQQHRTDAVKALIEDANNLSEKRRGRRLSASEIKAITEAAVKYYDAKIGGDNEEIVMEALPALNAALTYTGGTAGKIRQISMAFDDAADSGKELQSIVDELFKTDESSSGGGLTPDSDPTVTGGGVGGTPDTGGNKFSLSEDKEYLEQKLALQKQYVSGAIETEEELNEKILQLEIDTLRERMELAKGDELAELDRQLQERLIRQKNARLKKEKELVKSEAQLQLEQLNEREARAKTAHRLEMIALQNRHNEELAKAKKQGEDLTALKERQAKEVADAELRYISELNEILNELTGEEHEIKIDFQGTDAELTALKQKIEEIVALMNKLKGNDDVSYSADGGNTGKTSDNEAAPGNDYPGSNLFGVNTNDWEKLIQSMKDGKLTADEWATAIKGIGGAADFAMGLASQWAANQSKLEQQQLKDYEKSNDKKKAALEKRLDAGLISEEQYNAEVARLDAEYEAYQEEIALKQAKREKQLALIQAIINTAQSVTMALASSAPPASYIFAGINAAMGAAEIAMIASQPITTGYESGGLTEVLRAQDGKPFKARLSPERGLVQQPTVLVGENGSEYVIPHDGVVNPSLAPFLGTIETARRNGTLRNLDFGAVYSPMAMRTMGYAAGGYTQSSSAAVQPGAQNVTVTIDDETKALLKEIRAKQDDPTPAEVAMLGKSGIIKKMEEYERMRKRGRL